MELARPRLNCRRPSRRGDGDVVYSDSAASSRSSFAVPEGAAAARIARPLRDGALTTAAAESAVDFELGWRADSWVRAGEDDAGVMRNMAVPAASASALDVSIVGTMPGSVVTGAIGAFTTGTDERLLIPFAGEEELEGATATLFLAFVTAGRFPSPLVMAVVTEAR